jgi:sporulation protein YlmC with PRC-barrel domain
VNGSKRDVLGCLVTDIQTGETIGWVKNIIFDSYGEQITELLVDPTRKQGAADSDERGERLVGTSLFDSNSRYLGEIVDLVVGAESGRLHGLMIERTPGQQDFLPAYQGLAWEDDHWILMQAAPTLRSTMFPHDPDLDLPVDEGSGDDWMVGQVATVRLTDRQGHVIIEPGQQVTASVVEQANRAGVLHKLEATFPEEVGR